MRCNGHVRLDALLELADRLGAATLVTGHYARLAETDHPAGPLLRAAADPAKDQSYMLAALAPESLARLRFPLGELTKAEVRARARAAGLAVADKPDSQDLCFLAGTDRARFLARHGGVGRRRGELVDGRGGTVGVHDGQHGFTVGQRRGLGVAQRRAAVRARQGRRPQPGDRRPARARSRARAVTLRDVALHRPGARVDAVKLRYRSRAAARPRSPASARPGATTGSSCGWPSRPTRCAPGQLACLLDGELIVGHGTIARG